MYAFLYSKWVALPLPTRHAIAVVLNIKKTGPTHVSDNRVIDDGYTLDAVEQALQPENIKEVLGIDGEPEELWDALISRALAPIIPQAPVPAPVSEVKLVEKPQTVEESNAKPEKIKVIHEPTQAPKASPAKPRGRPRKVK